MEIFMLDITQLETTFSGKIVSSSHPEYDDSRKVYNANIDKRPQAILYCENEADVISAVNFARESNSLIAVRCQGHNGSGYSICDDGIVIDLSQIKYTRVDNENNTVRVGAGCKWEDVDNATAVFGKAVSSGVVSSTGVSGLTLGGGHGYISRGYGLAIDNLVEVDIVLSDGSYVKASENLNSDIFWGIRGGGGNFGIITSFVFNMAPVHDVFCGLMAWDLKDIQETFTWYDKLMKSARNDLYGFFAIQTIPPAPPFPDDLHNQKFCGVVWCYYGPKEEFEEAWAPIKAYCEECPPIMDGTHWATLRELNATFNELYPAGDQWYWKGDYFDNITSEVIEIHNRKIQDVPTWKSAMHLYPINGVCHDISADAMAWNDRQSNYSMVIVGVSQDAEDFDDIKSWATSYWKELNPHSSLTGSYVNWMMPDEDKNRVKSAYGSNYEKLLELKRKYDPQNIFSMNHNITP